jgi:glutamate/aspartate transport system substrate-binding protein
MNPIAMKLLNQFLHKTRRIALLAAAALAVAAAPAIAQTASAPAGLGPTLSKIDATGFIYVGHREAAMPFSYVTAGLETHYVYGYAWDVCQHVVKAVEERLGKPVRSVPVSVSANARILMVKIGMADLECGATTNNVARQKQVAFSNTFYVAEVKIMVRGNSGIKTVSDLANKKVVTTSGATADRLIKAAALSNNITMNYLVGRSHAESMGMLQRGEADAYAADDAILAAQRASSPTPADFVFLDGNLSVEPYGIMLPKGDAQFKKLVDDTLLGLMQSGELARIYERWFMQPIPPTGGTLDMPMSDLLKAAIANPNDRPIN